MVIPQHFSFLELVKHSTHHIFMRKKVSALGFCWGLVAIARTCLSHHAALQEKMLHCSVLVGVSTHHKFQKELDGEY